jgi:hypothetical protein
MNRIGPRSLTLEYTHYEPAGREAMNSLLKQKLAQRESDRVFSFLFRAMWLADLRLFLGLESEILGLGWGSSRDRDTNDARHTWQT